VKARREQCLSLAQEGQKRQELLAQKSTVVPGSKAWQKQQQSNQGVNTKTFLTWISTLAQPHPSWQAAWLSGLDALREDAAWISSPMENAMSKSRTALADEISILCNLLVPQSTTI
jgi:hypothetical protein